jgi:hypothetical protein
MARRLQAAIRALDPDQRLAGIAAVALLVTLFLPWYQKSVAVGNSGLDSQNLTAFGVFSFVEAAVMLVALAVFVLLFARAERRAFHLPGGDGTVILAAGAWAAVLLLWRVFDRPDVEGVGATVGITWGFFFAFVAAAALAGAGWRIRQAGRPEPPNPAADAPSPGPGASGAPGPPVAPVGSRAPAPSAGPTASGEPDAAPAGPRAATTVYAEREARLARMAEREAARAARRRAEGGEDGRPADGSATGATRMLPEDLVDPPPFDPGPSPAAPPARGSEGSDDTAETRQLRLDDDARADPGR